MLQVQDKKKKCEWKWNWFVCTSQTSPKATSASLTNVESKKMFSTGIHENSKKKGSFHIQISGRLHTRYKLTQKKPQTSWSSVKFGLYSLHLDLISEKTFVLIISIPHWLQVRWNIANLSHQIKNYIDYRHAEFTRNVSLFEAWGYYFAR